MSVNCTPDGDIVKAVSSVMARKRRVESQRELALLVQEELRKQDPSARAGAERIRRLAVSSGAVKLEIEYRDSSRDLPDICPVCRNGMAAVLNRTLDGGVAETGRKCTVCPYAVGTGMQVPGRYIFVYSRLKEPTPQDVSIRKLKKAASLLRSASKLIGEALEDTDFPQRKENAQRMIAEIVSSKEMAGSIPNLEADIRTDGHGDPLWTKPAATPKYSGRE